MERIVIIKILPITVIIIENEKRINGCCNWSRMNDLSTFNRYKYLIIYDRIVYSQIERNIVVLKKKDAIIRL
jgi:hypothetical protein